MLDLEHPVADPTIVPPATPARRLGHMVGCDVHTTFHDFTGCRCRCGTRLDHSDPTCGWHPQVYVVGFAIDGRGRVALIQKNRPAWQAGHWNGIGGHVEPGETPLEGMRREFFEETGTDLVGWQHLATLSELHATIVFYRLQVLEHDLDHLKSMTDEPVGLFQARSIRQPADPCPADIAGAGSIVPVYEPLIPNLAWLLPYATYAGDTYAPILVPCLGPKC